jgi:hypothetical protein
MPVFEEEKAVEIVDVVELAGVLARQLPRQSIAAVLKRWAKSADPENRCAGGPAAVSKDRTLPVSATCRVR